MGGAAHLICVQSSRSRVGSGHQVGGRRVPTSSWRVTGSVTQRPRGVWRNDENNASDATAAFGRNTRFEMALNPDGRTFVSLASPLCWIKSWLKRN